MVMLDCTLVVTLVCLISSSRFPILSQKVPSLVLVLRKAEEEERPVMGLKLLMVLLCKNVSPVDAILPRCVLAVVEGRSLAISEQKAFPLITNLLIPIKLQPNPQITAQATSQPPIIPLSSFLLASDYIQPSIILTKMTERQEQFPFQQFITALQQQSNLRPQLGNILTQIQAHNIYWIYSSVSTIVEIAKGKEEEPFIKCRAMEAARIMVELCEYPVVTLVEVYLLPVLWEVAIFKGRKSEELTSYYFQQTQGIEDSEATRRLSLEYVQRAIQLIFLTARLKPYRTVQSEEIKQESAFKSMQAALKTKGVQQPKAFVWTAANTIKDLRKLFLQKLRKFSEQSQPWVQFLLVNLLQQIRTNKKELLQLRQMLPYGQGYLTSAVINLCEDELMDLSENLQMKRKYLALIHEVVRYGDIEAIIMIKNSQFVPSIVAHFSKLQGHLGIQVGENIYPEVKSNKQVKRQFYADFLRCLETWAVSMPEDYDSQDFTLKQLYKLLKEDRKFKFPENIHMNRYQKELQQNLVKNKERNDKLIELLENGQESKQSQQIPVSKMSNVLQRTTLLAPSQLQNRYDEAKKAMKELMVEGTSEKGFKVLTSFKENWITYLQALDLQAADQGKLQALILSGQKCVQEIQLLTPFYLSYSKGKISFRDFKERMKEVVDLHNEVSANISHNKSKSINLSKSIIAKTKMARSKMGNSKLGGKELMDKIKAKSKFGDSSQMDLSKVIDRSQMLDKSKQLDRSRAQISKMQLKIESKAVVSKPERKEKYEIEPQQQQSPKNMMKVQAKKQEVKELQTPKSRPIQQKATQIVQTIKKENQVVKEASQIQPVRIRRIDDYEVTDIKQKEVQNNGNRLSSSREKGSKILLRRSQNKGSRLDRSSQSRHSEDRKSVQSTKKIKESSLSIKSPRLTSPTPKTAQTTQDEFLKDRLQINQTIQVNGNIIKQGAPTQKRTYKNKEDNSFNNFKDGVESISSIHSNSVLRIFQHNAERILDMTEQLGSEVKGEKRVRNEVVQHERKEELPPVVGDYYQETAKKEKNESPEQTPKKQQKNSFKSEESSEIRKTYFNQKEPEKPSVFKEQVKAKKEEKKQPIKSEAKQTHKANPPPQKNILNKTQKPTKPEKVFQVVQVLQINTQKPQPPKPDLQKDKQIQSLQQKIRELQRQTMLMKTKLAAKDNQIRSIKSSSKYGSERGYPQFTTLSQSHADNSERTSNRGSSLAKTRKTEPTRFQRDIQSQYKQYLQRIKGSTFRKSLLKLKCLVHKTDEIQIGCMSQRSDKSLECTLYVTPHRYNLLDFTMALIHDNCIRTKIVPEQIKLIPSKKQHKIHLTIQIVKIPFCLPEIEINYKSDSEYSSNYNRLTLPLCFSKFCQIRPLESEERQEKELQYIRSDTFKLNSKIIKLEKIGDCFPNFTILPPSKDREEYLLTASCRYLDSYFNILLNIGQKNSWIEGFLKQGDPKPMNFLICTFKQILDGSKK